MCKELTKEIKTLCSTSVNSILYKSQPENLMSFTWTKFEEELKQHSPLLFSVLMELTKTRRPRSNHSTIVCVCIAVLLINKFRYSKMSAIHKIILFILYSGHCSKQVSENTKLNSFM